VSRILLPIWHAHFISILDESFTFITHQIIFKHPSSKGYENLVGFICGAQSQNRECMGNNQPPMQTNPPKPFLLF
jgi:hypothetical protein